MRNPRPFTISLLGIDGSGKSTISKKMKRDLEIKGYRVKIVPFHYWIFAHKLKKKFWKHIDIGRETTARPFTPKRSSLSAIIKPLVALIDNIIFYISTMPDGVKWDIVIYDRFICSTQIKLMALGYRVEWLRFIWENFKTDYCFQIDVPEELSIERQKKRGDPYTYTKEELSIERREYLRYAKQHVCIVLDGTKEIEDNLYIIMSRLEDGKNII